MPDPRTKRAILAALGHTPDFSELATLPPANSSAGRKLLRWLDQCGLALLFLRRLQQSEVIQSIPVEWQFALSQRLLHNVERTRDMLEEAQRINAAFRAQGITAATLKGLTLTPDFCAETTLRHQADLDFLVYPGSVRASAKVLESCGYSTACLNESGETCFFTPLRHIPSADDDMYALQRHRQIDLHTTWEVCAWMPLEAPRDCLERAQLQSNHGVDCLSLSLEDKFVLQIFHAFRHAFRSWVRVSWLLEIGACMENHRVNVALWDSVVERAGAAQLTRRIFALVLGLVNRLFQIPIPSQLRAWSDQAMNLSLQTWLDHFAVDWAISDWPGSLNNLFLAADFISDRKLRMAYWRSRLLPKKSHTSIGTVTGSDANMFLRLQVARLRYMAHRSAVHLAEIASLPLEHFRWRRALLASRKGWT